MLLLATVRCNAVLPSNLFLKSTIAPPLTREITIFDDFDLRHTAKLRGVSEKKMISQNCKKKGRTDDRFFFNKGLTNI